MRAQPKAADVARERLIETVRAILMTGEPSRFRFEAACRHGLRRAWVLQSVPWALADTLAAEIVALAFVRMNVKRPTWDQGQRDYVEAARWDGLAECPTCHGAFEPASSSQRFCCHECQRVALIRRYNANGAQMTRAEYLAEQAARATAGRVRRTRACEHCGAAFEAPKRHPGQRFCSTKCHDAARRKIVVCEHCRTEFRPTRFPQRFCSKACSGASRRAMRCEAV